MKQPIWLPNLKRFLTGTTIGSSRALDVNVANTTPLPISPSELDLLEYRYMDFGVTGINVLSGAYVQIGDTGHAAADIANTITKAKVANNSGRPLLIGSGANAGAVTVFAVVAAGQTSEAVYAAALAAGDKVWIKSLDEVAGDSGVVLVTFYG